MKETRAEKFRRLAEPLINLINEDYHPHVSIIIDCNHAELLEGVVGFSTQEPSNADALEEGKKGCDEICSLCECEFSLSEDGGISGVFGVAPTAFCPTCYSSTVDMVIKTIGFDDIETLKTRIEELREEEELEYDEVIDWKQMYESASRELSEARNDIRELIKHGPKFIITEKWENIFRAEKDMQNAIWAGCTDENDKGMGIIQCIGCGSMTTAFTSYIDGPRCNDCHNDEQFKIHNGSGPTKKV